MSHLSTYFAGALLAVLLIDHAPGVGILRPAFELTAWPGEIAGPAITIDRARKGDRLVPERGRRDLVNAPLDVADLPTGSLGERRSGPASGSPIDNVTVFMKREAPVRDREPGKLPLGCESAFGRLAAPPLAHVLGRCII